MDQDRKIPRRRRQTQHLGKTGEGSKREKSRGEGRVGRGGKECGGGREKGTQREPPHTHTEAGDRS